MDHVPSHCAFCPSSAPSLSSWLLGSLAISSPEESGGTPQQLSPQMPPSVSSDPTSADPLVAPASKSRFSGLFSKAAGAKASSLGSSLMGTLSRLGTALTEPLRVHAPLQVDDASMNTPPDVKNAERSSGYVNLKGNECFTVHVKSNNNNKQKSEPFAVQTPLDCIVDRLDRFTRFIAVSIAFSTTACGVFIFIIQLFYFFKYDSNF